VTERETLVRIPQTRTARVRRESLPGLKCQTRSTRSSLYALIAEQKLKSIKVRGRRLITAAALRDLLQGAA
jgi:hypothetical protein